MDEQFQQSENENFNPPAESSLQSPVNPQVPQIIKQKIPIPVIILAILWMLAGISMLAYLVYFFFVVGSEGLPFSWLVLLGLFIFGTYFIIAAWGLRDMKKWGLYLVVSSLAFAILFAIFNTAIQRSESLFSGLISLLIDGAILGYLIYIRNKFEPEKPHRPILFVSIAAATIIIPAVFYIALKPYQQAQEKNLQTMQTEDLDHAVRSNVWAVGLALMDYQIEHDTYKGFTMSDVKADELEKIAAPDCQTQIKLDISPDGTKFVVYQPLCSDVQKSACFETDSTDPVISDTAKVEKTYSCK